MMNYAKLSAVNAVSAVAFMGEGEVPVIGGAHKILAPLDCGYFVFTGTGGLFFVAIDATPDAYANDKETN